ncbi:nucleotide-binding universal stress UspA family protein [Actinoplanes campanulatus]|uniref:Nucleotide-binding universal stress UspA family protein n=1 Tax=Actinoplanes campanulatus TaxID=113559 RepID=A0A7W5ASH6_9ACTN|nr:universal stress protein [Actinoplanes campanulatus]MBB3101475.1 nucleotide-binding universal stress UspA family protein [Actinoplanes campanulatus]GGN50669.1 universal stress protein [Actinoplanes campanulatus]GID42070.1 universal stress protein [Actinoplanes campanulatus]
MRTQTIAVAADGTDASRSAITWAAAEAQRRQQPLRIVHVLDWEWSAAGYGYTGEQFETDRRRAEALADEASRYARDAEPGIAVKTDVIVGDPAAQLIIDSENAGLLVLGHRGHDGFTGLHLGSVSQRVAAHAHCSVAVIRENIRDDRLPVAAGIDDSLAADGVLEAAFTTAHQRNVNLTLIRCCLPPFPHHRDGFPPADVHTTRQDEVEDGRLATLVEPWQAKFPDVRVEPSVSHGSAAGVLVGLSHDAQLVIVGSRGHGVIAGALLGSTGLQLLRRAACPVLIVRPEPEAGKARMIE